MGSGNWHINGGITVILEEDISESYWYEIVLDNLYYCLSMAWKPVSDIWVDNNSKVQFQSGLHQIVSHSDSYGHLFLSFVPRGDLEHPALAIAHTEVWANALFDRLQRYYPDMRVATSAWTSTKRLTRVERIAQ